MSDASYRWTRRLCLPPFFLSSTPLILHARRAALPGGYILAAPHLSFFDVPLLIRHAPRPIDFMAAAEVRGNASWNRFLRQFNTFFVDRSRRDGPAVRLAIARLQAGRVVGMFPEGAIRSGRDSVLDGGPLNPGIARLAQIAGVPVLPCLVLGGSQYMRVRGWLPTRSTRYGVIFGNPIPPQPDCLAELRTAYLALNRELSQGLRDQCAAGASRNIA